MAKTGDENRGRVQASSYLFIFACSWYLIKLIIGAWPVFAEPCYGPGPDFPILFLIRVFKL